MNKVEEIAIDGLGSLGMTDDELDGIVGSEIGRVQRQNLKTAVNRKVAAAAGSSLMDKEQKFLQTMSPKFGAESKSLMDRGLLAFGDCNQYVRAKLAVATTGIINVFDNSQNKDKVAGVTSFEKQKLGSGVNASIGRIEFMHDAVATSSNKTIASCTYAPIQADTDPTLLNSELVVMKNNIVVFRCQINQFVEKQHTNDGYANGINLKKNLLFLDEDTIQIQIITPTGATLAASTDNFIEVKFRGAETQPKQA